MKIWKNKGMCAAEEVLCGTVTPGDAVDEQDLHGISSIWGMEGQLASVLPESLAKSNTEFICLQYFTRIPDLKYPSRTNGRTPYLHKYVGMLLSAFTFYIFGGCFCPR